ncbi:MAG: hypothetical protein Q9159_003518 [Coniocarpon cinnabarinum]
MTTLDPDASTSLAASTTAIQPHTVTSLSTIHIGTRASLLARKQTDIVVDLLQAAWPDHKYEIHAHTTAGDKNQVTALHEIGAKSLWTAELEKLLLEKEVDMIVHSLKDMPTQLPRGCTVGAITKRGDPRDALVLHKSLPEGTTLSSLPRGSTIGTSSVRRSAQLKRLYPHLKFKNVRGNIGTRLRKLDESKLEEARDQGTGVGDTHTVEEDDDGTPQYSGIILAAAGLLRLYGDERIARYLSSDNTEETEEPGGTKAQHKGIFHAVGQGALGIEVREGDERIMELLRPIIDERTTLACLAERALMRTLEGGCSVPIGVETSWTGADGSSELTETRSGALQPQERLVMKGIVVSLDGTEAVEASEERMLRDQGDADEMGRGVAAKLVSQGADKILERINLNRAIIEEQGDA